MEWKSYYDEELHKPGTRDKIAEWLRSAELTSLPSLRNARAILSFPHTAIDYSGPLLARVVSALRRSGVTRILALGVMHGSMVPACRVAMEEGAAPEERDVAFGQVAGAFFLTDTRLVTPFGDLPIRALPEREPGAVRPDHEGLLRQEFSLDTFLAILRLSADVLRWDPPDVFPLFVGLTRHPLTGSFQTAEALASWLRTYWDASTAVVATGDVVHYGTAYGSEGEDVSAQALTSRFHRSLDRLFHQALAGRDLEAAYQQSLHVLKSDQREILPVLAYLLGEGASATLLSYELSDYAPIFDVPAPCLVASALIEYRGRSPSSPEDREFG